MCIPNIWENKIHIPVTTNQVNISIQKVIQSQRNPPVHIYYIRTDCISFKTRVETGSQNPAPLVKQSLLDPVGIFATTRYGSIRTNSLAWQTVLWPWFPLHLLPFIRGYSWLSSGFYTLQIFLVPITSILGHSCTNDHSSEAYTAFANSKPIFATKCASRDT